MAKYDLKFLDVSEENSSIRVEAYTLNNQPNEIMISLQNENGINNIWLDISTAIKFAKTLRTEINKAKEVNNG